MWQQGQERRGVLRGVRGMGAGLVLGGIEGLANGIFSLLTRFLLGFALKGYDTREVMMATMKQKDQEISRGSHSKATGKDMRPHGVAFRHSFPLLSIRSA